MRSVVTRITSPETSEWCQFSRMEDTKKLMEDRTSEGKQGLLTSFAAFYRRWVVLEPTIFLFLVSGRMVYFTRTNLFIDVSSFVFVFVFVRIFYTRANPFIDVSSFYLRLSLSG